MTKRHLIRLTALLVAALTATACTQDTPNPPASDTDTTTAPAATTAAPITTASPETTVAPETTTAPEQPPMPTRDPLTVECAAGYNIRTVSVPGDWDSLETYPIDGAYTLIRATKRSKDGSHAHTLHLMEMATDSVVDSLTIEGTPMDEIRVYPLYALLYALESEGDARSITRAATLHWDGGKLSLDEYKHPEFATMPIPAYWKIAAPDGIGSVTGGDGGLTYAEVAVLPPEGGATTPHKIEFRIPSDVPTRYIPIGFLDDDRFVFEAAGTGSPAAYRYGIADLDTNEVTPMPFLDELYVTHVGDGIIRAIGADRTIYAATTDGQLTALYTMPDPMTDLPVGNGILDLGSLGVVKQYADYYNHDYTVYTPDFAHICGKFRFDSDVQLLAQGNTLYLLGSSMPTVDTLPLLEEIAEDTIIARVSRGFTVQTVELPGDWEALSTHSLDDRYTLICTYLRQAPRQIFTDLHLFDCTQGKITASTSFVCENELTCVNTLDGAVYLHDLRSSLNDNRARPERAVRISYAADAIAVTEVDAATLPAARYAFTSPNGDYTILSRDNTIVRRAQDGEEKVLLTSGFDSHSGSLAYYTVFGFMDNGRLLYAANGEYTTHYGLLDIETGETTKFTALDGLSVSHMDSRLIYAKNEGYGPDEDYAWGYWAVSPAGERSLLYTVSQDEKYNRIVKPCGPLWREHFFAVIEKEGLYTYYNADFSEALAEISIPTGVNVEQLATDSALYLLGRNLPEVVTKVEDLPRPVPPAQPESKPVEPVDPETQMPQPDLAISLRTATGFSVHTVDIPGDFTHYNAYPINDRYTLFVTQASASNGWNAHLFDSTFGAFVAACPLPDPGTTPYNEIRRMGDSVYLCATVENGIQSTVTSAAYIRIIYTLGTMSALPTTPTNIALVHEVLTSPDGRYTVNSTAAHTLELLEDGRWVRTLASCALMGEQIGHYDPVCFVDEGRLLTNTRSAHTVDFHLLDVTTRAKITVTGANGHEALFYRDGLIYARRVSDGMICSFSLVGEKTILLEGKDYSACGELWLGRTTAGGMRTVTVHAADAKQKLAEITIPDRAAQSMTCVAGENALYLIGKSLPATPDHPQTAQFAFDFAGSYHGATVYDQRPFHLTLSIPVAWTPSDTVFAADNQRRLVLSTGLAHGALGQSFDLLFGSIVYDITKPITGKTAQGFDYLGFVGEPEASGMQRYVFCYNVGEQYDYYLTLWGYADELELVLLPLVQSVAVTLGEPVEPAELSTYDPDAFATLLPNESARFRFHYRMFASQTYLYFCSSYTNLREFWVYSNQIGSNLIGHVPLTLPADVTYDRARPIYAGSGGGSGECRILVELQRGNKTTVVQFDNFHYTDATNALDFAYRGEIDAEFLTDLLRNEPENFHLEP